MEPAAQPLENLVSGGVFKSQKYISEVLAGLVME